MSIDSTMDSNALPFLRDGGVSGELIRSINWTNHPLGHPAHWPDTLKITLSNMLASPFPMAISWGPAMFHFYNDAFIPLMGWTKHPAAMGNNIEKAYPESWHVMGPLFERVMQGEAMKFDDLLIPSERHGMVEEYWFAFSYSPIRDLDSAICGILVITIETTDKLLYERQLQESTEQLQHANNELTAAVHRLDEKQVNKTYQQLRLAVGTANLGTWNANLRTRRLTFSERGSEIFGLEPGINHPFEKIMEMIVPEYLERLRESARTAIETNKPLETDVEIRLANSAEIKWIRATGMVTHDKDHHPKTIAGTLLDITERKLDELRKNDFIGMVSHELKTPLTSISAVIQMAQMKEQSTNEEFLQYAMQKANVQVKRMAKLINGFLNISRLESGKVHLDKTSFDLDQLVNEIIEELSFTAHGHEIRFSTCSGLQVVADREKIGSVINNLLSNAIKYSGAGTPIELTCVSQEKEAVIAVTDQGIGIDKDDQSRIFERYYRVATHNRKVSGFGIGLYLSSEIIQRHNGRIGVESEPGKGSTFYFSLPLE